MFNEFRKVNLISELKSLLGLLAKELAKIKELETVDISIETKKEKLDEIKNRIDTIECQIDNVRSEIKLDTDFKNN